MHYTSGLHLGHALHLYTQSGGMVYVSTATLALCLYIYVMHYISTPSTTPLREVYAGGV